MYDHHAFLDHQQRIARGECQIPHPTARETVGTILIATGRLMILAFWLIVALRLIAFAAGVSQP